MIPQLHVSTDCARYNPHQIVHLSVTGPATTSAKIQFAIYAGGNLVKNDLTANWTGAVNLDWAPPATDGQGYLVVATVKDSAKHVVAQGWVSGHTTKSLRKRPCPPKKKLTKVFSESKSPAWQHFGDLCGYRPKSKFKFSGNVFKQQELKL